MLEEAKFLLSRGISVIPVKGRTGTDVDDSKRPVVSWKEFQTRQPSMIEVGTWFKFSRYNLAVVTGQVSRIITLDVDVNKGGADSIKDKFIPLTWCDKSNNGLHYHFRWVSAFDNVKTTDSDYLPGIDVRGNGGYCIVPPSIGFSGQPYAWIKAPTNTPLAYPPAWLVDLIVTKQTSKRSLEIGNKQGWIAEALVGLKEGNRDHTFIRLAGRLWHDGLEVQDIFSILKPHAEISGFGLDELMAKVDQVSKYDRQRGEYIVEELEKEEAITLTELFSDNVKDVEWQIDRVLPKEGLLILGGRQGIGKTFLALDLCIELAKGGGSWLGRFAVNPGSALYIDEENGASLLKQRLKAMLKSKGIVKVPEGLHLCIEHNYKIDNEKSVEKLKRKLEKYTPSVVVLDSLRRLHSRNENDSGEVAFLFDVLKKLARTYHCSFVILDHERKSSNYTPEGTVEPSSDDLRGSNDKGAAADAVVSIKEKKGELYLYHTKVRYAKPFLPVLVQIEDDEANKTIAVRGY